MKKTPCTLLPGFLLIRSTLHQNCKLHKAKQMQCTVDPVQKLHWIISSVSVLVLILIKESSRVLPGATSRQPDHCRTADEEDDDLVLIFTIFICSFSNRELSQQNHFYVLQFRITKKLVVSQSLPFPLFYFWYRTRDILVRSSKYCHSPNPVRPLRSNNVRSHYWSHPP